LLYFFIQAEDGIRDRNVTGVQTCALPILTYCANHGGICFVLFLFKERDEAYVYPITALLEDWTSFLANDITAIPLKKIQTKGFSVYMGYQPQIDYLAAVDKMIEVKD